MVLLEVSCFPLDGLIHFPWYDTLPTLTDQSLELGTVLAQSVEDPEVLQNIQDSWTKFIETGQVWALIIGFVFGYIFRSFTGF
ncbi:MAG: hypothetical protein AB4058_18820 [Microcystaceae cyanobacterium]